MSDDRMTVNASAPVAAAASVVQRPNASLAVAKTPVQPPESQPARAQVAAPDIQQVAQRIDSYLKSVSRSLEFRVDDASGHTVVSVRDAESGDLIRQIPNEEVLRFAQMAEDQTIVLLNEKV